MVSCHSAIPFNKVYKRVDKEICSSCGGNLHSWLSIRPSQRSYRWHFSSTSSVNGRNNKNENNLSTRTHTHLRKKPTTTTTHMKHVIKIIVIYFLNRCFLALMFCVSPDLSTLFIPLQKFFACARTSIVMVSLHISVFFWDLLAARPFRRSSTDPYKRQMNLLFSIRTV